MTDLLSGNEAIALGAYQGGAKFGFGYPGTPSTETLESFAKLEGVKAEWCTNEKVALEVAIGASAAGKRSLVTMKHVGLNVAADPLFTSAYTGVGAGLVILVADDPGMYSSQNEQDSHYYAQASHIPMLDPADSQEAYDFTRAAYQLSESFDTPVLIRSEVRISHTRGLVEAREAAAEANATYEKRPDKWVMMPAFAKGRRIDQVQRIEDLSRFADETDLNRVEIRSSKMGIVCAGASYQYVRDALPNASVFKLGMSYPLPRKKLAEFADSVDDLYVIEEASTFFADSVRSLGIEVSKPENPLPRASELSVNLIKLSFGIGLDDHMDTDLPVPARPPSLCAGCPHRIVFKELSRMKAIVTGDIGCYTLGALPPLAAMDTCIDMGASVSMAHGFEIAMKGEDHPPIVGIIGDSTFAHSGLSSLITTVYNKGTGIICILDNRTTAMTGRQGNPFNGIALQGDAAKELDLEKVVRAIGVEDVKTVDPNDLQAVRDAFKDARGNADTLSVIIFKRPCVLLERQRQEAYFITSCTGCGVCLTLGCPSIGRDTQTGLAYIDTDSCIGCGQCAQYCRFNAISR